ncbi:MAG TPA: hypothetical protein VJY35_10135 [Candidatus Eisenbacteria bacterium]|nr:hypothetical protein [Candidatus Eisenbacteria bacterium]
MRLALIAFVALALAGCSSQKSADTAAAPATGTTEAPTAAAAPSGDATPANPGASAAVQTGDAKPTLIAELTDQTLVYECPKCGMMYDKAGTCTMGCGETVAMQVDYSCPADGKPVEKAGHCPRCPMNARVEKTALAASAPSGKN